MHFAVLIIADFDQDPVRLLAPYNEELFYNEVPTAQYIAFPAWDSWSFGGRWREANNYLRGRAIEDLYFINFVPAVILTPDGRWHEDNERDPTTGVGRQEWEEGKKLMKQYEDRSGFIVDCHV